MHSKGDGLKKSLKYSSEEESFPPIHALNHDAVENVLKSGTELMLFPVKS
jgi:hypothetical protein